MGLAAGAQAQAFGHSQQAAVDIDGLTLLEDHLAAAGEDEEMDDEKAWANWEVEEDSSESESESEGWIEVESDGDDLEISDSEDEEDKMKGKKRKGEGESDEEEGEKEEVVAVEVEEKRISTLATTKVRSSKLYIEINLTLYA